MKPVTINDLMLAVTHDDEYSFGFRGADLTNLLEIALQKKIGVLALCEPVRIELGNGHILNVTVEGETPTPMSFHVQELRPEVLAFALLMEQRLRQHDADKQQTWKSMSTADLCVHAFSKATRMECERLDLRHPVDLANYAMMIADVAGALDEAVEIINGEPQH